MIGCFRYLNAYPYRRHLERAGIPYRLFEDPKSLAEAWQRGEVVAALLPLRYVHRPSQVLPWGIGSAGPIQSVLLLSEYPPSEWKALVPDSASTSSIALIQWLMHRKSLPPLPIVSSPSSPQVGRLFIGDSALRWKKFYPYALDLGALAHERLRKPFVYAVWCARKAFYSQLNALFREPWDLFSWAEEAAWEYHFSATEVYRYWQAIRYRLSRRLAHFWRCRLPSLSPENLTFEYARSQ